MKFQYTKPLKKTTHVILVLTYTVVMTAMFLFFYHVGQIKFDSIVDSLVVFNLVLSILYLNGSLLVRLSKP